MAQQYGLGNFLYEVEVSGGKANFTFRDPQDASNTAEVSISQSDFPEGVSADSRQVADIAYDQCQRVLNDKRDAREKKEANDALAAKTKEEAEARQKSQDYLSSTEDTVVQPAGEDKEGNMYYNTANLEDNQAPDNKKK